MIQLKKRLYAMWKETSQRIFDIETIRILYQIVILKKHDIKKKRLSSRNSVYVTEWVLTKIAFTYQIMRIYKKANVNTNY